MLGITFSFLWATFMALFTIPTMMRVAYHKGILDKPSARKQHFLPVPLLGGFGMYASVIIAVMLFIDTDDQLNKLLAGSFVLFLLGIKDDITGSSPVRRLFIQIIVSCMVIVVADLRIQHLHGLFGITQLHPFVSYSISFLFLIALINAFNFIDGIDGLLGLFTLFFCAALACLLQSAHLSFAGVLISLGGAMMSYLRYNLSPRRIFMGDGGSVVCGYWIAVAAIRYMATPNDTHTPAVPITLAALLFYPILDTLQVIISRLTKGISPMKADRTHIHYLLKRYGIHPYKILTLLVGANVLLFLTVFYFAPAYPYEMLGGLVVLAVGIPFGLHRGLRNRLQLQKHKGPILRLKKKHPMPKGQTDAYSPFVCLK